MRHYGPTKKLRVNAALPTGLVLALAGATAAPAQDALPSVSEYRLPSSSPTARPQGPVDEDVPVVRSVPAAQGAGESAEAPSVESKPAADPPASIAPAVTSARPPRSAGPIADRVTVSAVRPARAITPPLPRPAPSAAISPQNQVSNSVVSLPTVAQLSPPDWRVHSARERLANQALEFWPWLVGLAFLLGAGLAYLFQKMPLRRLAGMAETRVDHWDFAEAPKPVAKPSAPKMPRPAVPKPVMPAAVKPAPLAASEAPEFDVRKVLAETGLAEVADLTDAPAATRQADAPREYAAARPALGVLVNPLEITLAARKMSATLLNTVLNYELVVTNNGDAPMGPVSVGGDMIGAHASLSARSQLEIAGQSIKPLHRLDTLAPGESLTLLGELRLPLAAILPIRNGNASLFVPLARFRVEALRDGAPPLVVSRTFVIGETQANPGAALKPFRLDLGPRLYSQIGQRELALTA